MIAEFIKLVKHYVRTPSSLWFSRQILQAIEAAGVKVCMETLDIHGRLVANNARRAEKVLSYIKLKLVIILFSRCFLSPFAFLPLRKLHLDSFVSGFLKLSWLPGRSKTQCSLIQSLTLLPSTSFNEIPIFIPPILSLLRPNWLALNGRRTNYTWWWKSHCICTSLSFSVSIELPWENIESYLIQCKLRHMGISIFTPGLGNIVEQETSIHFTFNKPLTKVLFCRFWITRAST